MLDHTEVAIIGGGVIGAAVAYRLAQAGAQVVVLESADRLGAGTSGRSFAWTNSNEKTPRPYHDLNVAGMRAHAALCDEFGSIPWWHDGGSVEWFATDQARAAQAAKVERLQTWGYSAEWITPGQLHELEPDVDLASVGNAPIAFYADEGWLDPVVYLHAMLQVAQRHGATVRTSSHVEHLFVKRGRVGGVALGGGERLSADLVVNCAGRWADTLDVQDVPVLKLPLVPTLGLLAFTPPIATGLRRIVRSPFIHMRPDGAGRLVLHGDDADALLTSDTTPDSALPLAQEMVHRAAAVLPSIGRAVPEAVRIGVRPIPADGLSAVGPMPGVDGYYVVVTHSGVTLSAFLARAVANEIVHHKPEPRLAPFRPSRLIETGITA
ncbi:MAG: FAD-binding oxidoreductase [Chloroflexota bacterium]|nr:FAD-binding oxidoreductase [Chloroflexota bacterium]